MQCHFQHQRNKGVFTYIFNVTIAPKVVFLCLFMHIRVWDGETFNIYLRIVIWYYFPFYISNIYIIYVRIYMAFYEWYNLEYKCLLPITGYDNLKWQKTLKVRHFVLVYKNKIFYRSIESLGYSSQKSH